MNTYRLMATAVTTCAACLSLAACTAGITTASSATSSSPAASGITSSPATTASHARSTPSSSANTVNVDAPIGSFPIPREANVLYNSTCGKQVLIELGSVTPSQASSFYTSALPRAGYKITSNSLLTDSGDGFPGSAAQIEFTGHRYKGTITAVSNLGALASTGPSPVSVPSSIAKNFFTITLTPPGASGCPGDAPPGS